MHCHLCRYNKIFLVLNLHVGLDFIFVFFMFSIYCFFVWLRHFFSMLHTFVVLGLISLVPSQEVGWKEGL